MHMVLVHLALRQYRLIIQIWAAVTFDLLFNVREIHGPMATMIRYEYCV